MANKGFIVEHPHTGQRVTVAEMETEFGINFETLADRWKKGHRGDDLIAPVPERRKNNSERFTASYKRAQSQRQFTRWLTTPSGRLSTRLFRDYAGGAA
ncbi:hypothetical protein [Salinicola sp. CPA57]|uniref:hypothetical protein n=1 Tax=Salinicola sp. CPA57 TaxID=1949080 RepID=UPI000DA1FEF3|nr:hypothetical protein [Salinicola sp. CPA57]